MNIIKLFLSSPALQEQKIYKQTTSSQGLLFPYIHLTSSIHSYLSISPYSWESGLTANKRKDNMSVYSSQSSFLRNILHPNIYKSPRECLHLYPLPAQSPSPSPLQAIYCMQAVNSELFTSTCFDIIQVISWSYNSPTCLYTQLYVIILHTTRRWELQQIFEEKLLQEKSKIHSLSHVTWHKAN